MSNTPYQLSRATLQSTVRMLRELNPSLALRVQNQMAVPSTESGRLTVQLDSFTLGRIIETIAAYAGNAANRALNHEDITLADLQEIESVIAEWLLFAESCQGPGTETGRLRTSAIC